MGGKIVGTGSYVPETIWDNDKIMELVETSNDWIVERTGIKERHIDIAHDSTKMAVEAGKRAVEDAIKRGAIKSAEDIDAIIVCSVAPELLLPAVACKVQEEIGAKHAFAYDMNAACSGFVFAYNSVVSLMNMNQIEHALIIGCEGLSSIVNWKDRSSCILFGDGAGAVVFAKAEGESGMVMHSDGNAGTALRCENGGKMTMDGQKVFRFAIKSVPECIEELLVQMNISKEDIDYFILHQANQRIIDAITKKLKVNQEKIPSNISRYGNTSSASIPILLDELYQTGKLKEGKRMIMAGFGAGLSWGAAYVLS